MAKSLAIALCAMTPVLPGTRLSAQVSGAGLAELEEILVTGTRIPRPDFESASPIVTVDAKAFDLGGALLGSIEARTKALYGQRAPQGAEMSRLDYQMVTCREPV